ncbi:MAG: AMMECR1 domain-containing protein, partial [Planctomycetota bacterium]
VEDIDIEISVLLPEKKIDDPLDWEFGKHGIIVRRGYRSATFLPQVARHFKTRKQMLCACCRKAGLPMYIWRDPGTTVYVYRAQVFGEKTLGDE